VDALPTEDDDITAMVRRGLARAQASSAAS
jgi:hypothetical protein